jgi:hypothetical protein
MNPAITNRPVDLASARARQSEDYKPAAIEDDEPEAIGGLQNPLNYAEKENASMWVSAGLVDCGGLAARYMGKLSQRGRRRQCIYTG